jgi:hypothetical protein
MGMLCACSMVRLLYHAATVKVSGNVDNESLIGCERKDHRFGFGGWPTKPTWGSCSPPSARSSGTTLGTSPAPFHGRSSREGGVVTVTSRYTKTQRMKSNNRYICAWHQSRVLRSLV